MRARILELGPVGEGYFMELVHQRHGHGRVRWSVSLRSSRNWGMIAFARSPYPRSLDA
jgi:hypothetical protein